MKSLSLSDAHIWNGGPADDFHISDSVLVAFFEAMFALGYDFIVLVGDWFELLKEDLYSDAENWHAIAAAHPVLVAYLRRRIAEGKIIYVSGNHDSYIRTGGVFPEAVKKFLWVSPDAKVRILWEHGHHGDFICKKLGVISRLGVWIGSVLEAAGIIDADTLWNWLRARFGDPGKPDFKTFYKYIVGRAREFNAQAVICGHTHFPLVQKLSPGARVDTTALGLQGHGTNCKDPELLVANDGCCVEVPSGGKFPAVHAEWNPGDVMPRVELKYLEV